MRAKSGELREIQRDQNIGRRLHKQRKELRLSISKLATLSGVSPGMISQIERQRTNPSLKILERLGEALQVPLATLLDGSAEPAAHHDLPLVRRKAERPEFPVGNNGMMKELLSPTGAHDLQLMVITLPPGVGSEDVLIGEGEKAGLVLEGVLTVEVGAKKIELAKGDSVQFNSSLTHRVNNHGDENAKFIWVISTSPPIAHI